MTLLIVVVFVAGLSFLLYPTVSDLWNRAHQSRAIATYTEQVEKLDDSSNKEMLKVARKQRTFEESRSLETVQKG